MDGGSWKVGTSQCYVIGFGHVCATDSVEETKYKQCDEQYVLTVSGTT